MTTHLHVPTYDRVKTKSIPEIVANIQSQTSLLLTPLTIAGKTLFATVNLDSCK